MNINVTEATVIDPAYGQMAIGVVVTGLVSAALGWFLGTFTKVSKKEHDAAITEMRNEQKHTNDELKQFVRQAAIDEVKADIRRIEDKIDTKLGNIQQQLVTLIARDK